MVLLIVVNHTCPKYKTLQQLRILPSQQTQQQVALQWEVFQPAVVASFEVQRSSDGRNFSSIHSQQVTAQTGYRYADVPPYAGRWYYRLRMIDGAGLSSYSEVVHTQWKQQAGGIKIMGNPVQNELWFTNAPAMEPIEYRVLALNGSIALQGRLAPATTQQRLPVRHLPSGVYHLQLHYANGTAETTRFIKQ